MTRVTRVIRVAGVIRAARAVCTGAGFSVTVAAHVIPGALVGDGVIHNR